MTTLNVQHPKPKEMRVTDTCTPSGAFYVFVHKGVSGGPSYRRGCERCTCVQRKTYREGLGVAFSCTDRCLLRLGTVPVSSVDKKNQGLQVS